MNWVGILPEYEKFRTVVERRFIDSKWYQTYYMTKPSVKDFFLRRIIATIDFVLTKDFIFLKNNNFETFYHETIMWKCHILF